MAELKSLSSLLADANLKAYYRQESGALGTDTTANGYTLTNNNTVGESSSGQYGYCSDFSTTNANKSLSRADQLGIAHDSDRTINIWTKIRTAPTSGNYISIVSQGYTTNKKAYQIIYGNEAGSLVVYADYLGGSGGEYVCEYRADLGTSNWHMLTLTLSGTTMNIYHNGVYSNQVSIDAANGADVNILDLTVIGRMANSSATRYASIYADDCSFFNRALTATEIKDLYADFIYLENDTALLQENGQPLLRNI